MPEAQVEVRIGGMGGQGLVTIGAVLAEAGALAGMNIAASQSYGSQARGGATYSDVILSGEWIDFPHVEHPHLLLVFAQEAYESYTPILAEGGVVLADGFFVKLKEKPGLRQASLDATGLALGELGNRLAANFVLLGAACGYTELVAREHLEQAAKKIVSPRFLDLNTKAIELGWSQAGALRKELGPWR